MRHKYLEEQGFTSYADNDWGNDTKHPIKNIFRKIKFYFRKRKTGVDPRSCYDLDTETMLWIYEHICQFIDDADTTVDLDFKKFDFEGKTYTLKEMLNLLKSEIVSYMRVKENYDISTFKEEYESEKEHADRVFDIMKLVIPFLWW